MLRADIRYQIAALLNPSKLQLDTVDDFHFFVCVYKIMQAAVDPLIFPQFCDRCLVSGIDEYIFRKAPVLLTTLQKLYKFDCRIRWGKRLIQICIAIYLLIQGCLLYTSPSPRD